MTLLCVRHELHTVYEILTPSPFHCSDPLTTQWHSTGADDVVISRICCCSYDWFICRQPPSPHLVSLSNLLLVVVACHYSGPIPASIAQLTKIGRAHV